MAKGKLVVRIRTGLVSNFVFVSMDETAPFHSVGIVTVIKEQLFLGLGTCVSARATNRPLWGYFEESAAFGRLRRNEMFGDSIEGLLTGKMRCCRAAREGRPTAKLQRIDERLRRAIGCGFLRLGCARRAPVNG